MVSVIVDMDSISADVYTDGELGSGDPVAAYYTTDDESDIVMLGTGYKSYGEAAYFAFHDEQIPEDVTELHLFGLDAIANKKTTVHVRG